MGLYGSHYYAALISALIARQAVALIKADLLHINNYIIC